MTEKTDIVSWILAHADFKYNLQKMSNLKLNCASESYTLTDLKTSMACFMLKL